MCRISDISHYVLQNPLPVRLLPVPTVTPTHHRKPLYILNTPSTTQGQCGQPQCQGLRMEQQNNNNITMDRTAAKSTVLSLDWTHKLPLHDQRICLWNGIPELDMSTEMAEQLLDHPPLYVVHPPPPQIAPNPSGRIRWMVPFHGYVPGMWE